MNVFDKYDEIIQEMNYLKNIQTEIDRKTRVLQARLVNPGVSVKEAYFAYKYLDCEIDVLWKKARIFEEFYNNLQKSDKEILNGVLSQTNIFLLADTLGITTSTIYSRLNAIFGKYQKSKEVNQEEFQNGLWWNNEAWNGSIKGNC